jgi:hypothetical protein
MNHFFSLLYSCRGRDIFPVLGAFSRATHHGSLWKNNEEVVQ